MRLIHFVKKRAPKKIWYNRDVGTVNFQPFDLPQLSSVHSLKKDGENENEMEDERS